MKEYEDKKYISRVVLYALGYSQYKLNKLVETGDLVMICREGCRNFS